MKLFSCKKTLDFKYNIIVEPLPCTCIDVIKRIFLRCHANKQYARKGKIRRNYMHEITFVFHALDFYRSSGLD